MVCRFLLSLFVPLVPAPFAQSGDPVLGGPVWTAEGNQHQAYLGRSVAGAGDVNGDGFDDVIVGSIRYDNGEADEGRAFLYLGSASGPSLVPDWTAESDQERAYLGKVASAGDVNGDGFDDVIVGASQFSSDQRNDGGAFLYLGSPSGLSLVPDWAGDSDQTDSYYGHSVAGAGDVNGDGFDDLIVGAANYDNGHWNEGRAYVYLGSPAGPALAAHWTAEGDQHRTLFGVCVASAGDVNGDGFDDVVVGAPSFSSGESDEGKVFLYLGSASGPSPTPSWTAESDQSDARFGRVSGAGDVNGDGFDDLIVGADDFVNASGARGRAYLYLGSAVGPSLTADWIVEGSDEDNPYGFASSVAGAGDVNRDGFDDVIVGSVLFSGNHHREGRALLYLGSASGLSPAPSWTAQGHQYEAYLGRVAGAGDVNGDDYDDVIIGASGFSNGEYHSEGRVLLYLGNLECAAQSYCQGGLNSAGTTARIGASGAMSLAANDFALTIDQAPPNRTGILYFGGARVMVPFGDGYRCVGAGSYGSPLRLQPVLQTDAFGSALRVLDFGGSTNANVIVPLTETTFQFWYRDPGGPLGTGFNLSDGLAVTFCP